MALTIYNSLSREKEEFKPINPPHVGLYTCGPTVYNYPQIGNYRAYVFGDILKRYLVYRGYKVNHVMNITDVDDKTIRDSQKEGKNLKEFTEFYTKAFFADLDKLNIIKADTYTKATEYIPKMVEMIEILLEKNFAYKTEDGSIYFDIRKDKEYGKLSQFKISDLKENAEGRLKKDEYEKENAEDFALWKSWNENDGDVFWETSLGKGRPGWHIECSVMSTDRLGESFDIHTGGIDLMFPHHENEIAQSECATGKPFVKYWMHNEHLMVDGKRMGKSLGNSYTLRDIIEKGVNPLAFRYWLYTGHYSTKVNFTFDAVFASQTALSRLFSAYKELLNINSGVVDTTYKEKFIESMDNNLDTPKAISILWELIHDADISGSDKKSTLLDFDQVLGLGLDKIKENVIPIEIENLSKEREQARKDKDWSKSDELRDEIKKLGYEVKDTEIRTKIYKI